MLHRHRSGSGGDHRDVDLRTNLKGKTLVRIRQHCIVAGHIETGYENGANVGVIPLVPRKRNPRLVVTLDVVSECTSEPGILHIRWMPRFQCRTMIPREPK